MIFQERLRESRKEKHEIQLQVATAIGISDRHDQKFEAGANRPSFDDLRALADHFEVSVDDLMGRRDQR